MTIEMHVDESRKLTVFFVQGEISFEEQISVLREFYAGTPTPNVIWDFRKITGSRISVDELREIIAFIKLHQHRRGHGKTAMVTDSDLDFGLSRVSRTYGEIEELPWRIHPFRSMEEALEWIEADS